LKILDTIICILINTKNIGEQLLLLLHLFNSIGGIISQLHEYKKGIINQIELPKAFCSNNIYVRPK
jgi:hypothetical protein